MWILKSRNGCVAAATATAGLTDMSGLSQWRWFDCTKRFFFSSVNQIVAGWNLTSVRNHIWMHEYMEILIASDIPSSSTTTSMLCCHRWRKFVSINDYFFLGESCITCDEGENSWASHWKWKTTTMFAQTGRRCLCGTATTQVDMFVCMECGRKQGFRISSGQKTSIECVQVITLHWNEHVNLFRMV